MYKCLKVFLKSYKYRRCYMDSHCMLYWRLFDNLHAWNQFYIGRCVKFLLMCNRYFSCYMDSIACRVDNCLAICPCETSLTSASVWKRCWYLTSTSVIHWFKWLDIYRDLHKFVSFDHFVYTQCPFYLVSLLVVESNKICGLRKPLAPVSTPLHEMKWWSFLLYTNTSYIFSKVTMIMHVMCNDESFQNTVLRLQCNNIFILDNRR